jgi:nucleolin
LYSTDSKFASLACIGDYSTLGLIYTLPHKQTFQGRPLRVNCGPPPPRDDSAPRAPRGGGSNIDSGNKVYVGNLSWGVDNATLENLFSEQGQVVDARVIYDRESGRSRGFGFVTYGSSEEVNNAISNLDGIVSSTSSLFCIRRTLLFCFEDVLSDCFIAMQDLDGRQIRVTAAESKPRRQF